MLPIIMPRRRAAYAASSSGTRRVDNLITSPESLAVGDSKTITIPAGTYMFSMGAGASAGIATFSGTSGVSGKVVQHASKRVAVPLYNLAAGTVIITASIDTLINLQLENITEQANPTPSEFVIGVQYFGYPNSNATTAVQGVALNRGPVGATWDGNDNGYYAYPPAVGNTAEETLENIIANKLGFVYQWSAANGNICPKGWHLPTDAEQNTLDQYLTDSGQTCDASRVNLPDCAAAGTKLKSGGTSGLNIPLSGYRGTNGSLTGRTSYMILWSSYHTGTAAWRRYLTFPLTTVTRGTSAKAISSSVRCLKDSNNTDSATTIYDADGNSYGVVTVGAQTWLNANLMTSHYMQLEIN